MALLGLIVILACWPGVSDAGVTLMCRHRRSSRSAESSSPAASTTWRRRAHKAVVDRTTQIAGMRRSRTTRINQRGDINCAVTYCDLPRSMSVVQHGRPARQGLVKFDVDGGSFSAPRMIMGKPPGGQTMAIPSMPPYRRPAAGQQRILDGVG